MFPRRATFLACCLAACLLGCRRPAPPEQPPPWFEDVTDARGIDFTHDPGPIDGKYFMPQSIGSGAALFDADGDGRLDILLLNNGGPKGRPNRLYLQNADRSFRDASAGSGLDFAGHCMGVAVADADGDGRPDVYVSEYAGGRLLLNQGGGRFRDAGGLAPAPQRWGTAASFLDHDRDGWPDLAVANYVEVDPTFVCSPGGVPDYCNPERFKGLPTRLFRNLGRDPQGKWLGFAERTAEAGMGAAVGNGLGLYCADFDGDGWADIYVANDGTPSRLWINRKDGTFADEALARGLAYDGRGEAQGNMGVAFADVEGKGLASLFVTHLAPQPHGLWKELPGPRRGYFQEAAASSGLNAGRWRGTGWGVALADFDHDGAPDAAVVNGKVFRAGQRPTASHWDAYAERSQLFVNDGTGRFRDRSPDEPALCGAAAVGRGLALGDLDDDGGLDLLVTAAGGRARLYRNVARRGHWLAVRAVDARGRDAVGAVARVGRQGRVVQPSHGYLCCHDPRAHFGLGDAARLDAVEVTWPDGTAERFACGEVDRVLEARQGKGVAKGRAAP